MSNRDDDGTWADLKGSEYKPSTLVWMANSSPHISVGPLHIASPPLRFRFFCIKSIPKRYMYGQKGTNIPVNKGN